MLSKQLIASVKKHEGFRSRTYEDTVGIPTIGYGTNLLELEICREQAEVWMRRDLEKVKEILSNDERYCGIYNRVRRETLIEMGYNLGTHGLFKFKKMWAAIEIGDYDTAATEMLDSKWSDQVGRRSNVLAEQMRTGKWRDES